MRIYLFEYTGNSHSLNNGYLNPFFLLSENQTNNSYKNLLIMEKNNLNIKKPSAIEIEKCLQIWETHAEYEKYRCQGNSAIMLFKEQYPKNTEIQEILLKVSVLNDYYSTNIRDTFSVAKHIADLKIDSRLSSGNTDIIDEIAKINLGEKSMRFYSFATKYCSLHYPDHYPIYDSIVANMLAYFKSQDKFAQFTKKGLRDYPTFKNVILEFQKFYELEKFSLREIDKYLWVLGKSVLNSKNKQL